MSQPTTEAVPLVEAASYDPVLAAVLLRYRSLPFTYNPQGSSYDPATQPVDHQVVCKALVSVRIETKTEHQTCLAGFRHHSAGCAVTSELLARRLGYPVPGHAFLAGLLHDLGKIVLSTWNRSVFQSVCEQSAAQRIPILPLEQQKFGIGHDVAGGLLMEAWNLPVFLPAVCHLHHQSGLHLGAIEPRLPLIVQQADRLSHLWDFGGGISLTSNELAELSRSSQLSADDFCELFVQASARLREIKRSFEEAVAGSPEEIIQSVWRTMAEYSGILAERNRRLEHRDVLSVATRLLATARSPEAEATPQPVTGAAEGILDAGGESREEELLAGTDPVGTVGAAGAMSPDLSASLRHPTSSREAPAILIAEDDAGLRRLLIEVLERAGHKVEGAEDGLDAIRKLINRRYLAAVVDLQMPRVDGLEVLVTSRRIAPEMPIVVLTGIVGPDGIEAARDAGAFRCLQKPASNDVLLRALDEALASRADAPEVDREEAS